MNHPLKPPEPPSEYLEANDLQYLKADDLYFSKLRNRLGLFESKVTVFREDKRVKLLAPILDLAFKKRNPETEETPLANSRPDALDVCCGDGNFLITLALKYAVTRCEGLDLSASKLKCAIANCAALRKPVTDHQSDKELTKEIKKFLSACPKNLLFEQDLRLFHRFFESANEVRSHGQNGGLPQPEPPKLPNVTLNFKLQNVYSYQGNEKFLVVFCLRMTKWIYLTMGDESIRMLLDKVLAKVAENGILVLGKVKKSSFKQTARLVHKKANSTFLFGRHQAAIREFMDKHGLVELEGVTDGEEARKHFWVLTREENKFWDDVIREKQTVQTEVLLK